MGKVQYDNMRAARSAALSMRRDRGEYVRVYRCTACGAPHLTTASWHQERKQAALDAGPRRNTWLVPSEIDDREFTHTWTTTALEGASL
jgi:hypothetical protein